jgi:hypothetical protein
MAGEAMLSFIPLHLSALTRSPAVLSCIQSWCPIQAIQPLIPSEWFERGHGIHGGTLNKDGTWTPLETGKHWLLWAPPPAVGATVLEEFNILRIKKAQHQPHLCLSTPYDTILEMPFAPPCRHSY